MNKQGMTDMTQGSPSRLIIAFAVPLLISNIFQQLYSMVDTWVVGRFVSSDALAAIGNCTSINFMLISMYMGLATGVGIIVAQYYGAGDEEHVRKTITNAFYVLQGVAVLTTIIGVAFAPLLLRVMQTPESLFDDSVLYMQISCMGSCALALYNGVASILRALGDSRRPLYFLIISSILNIILDLFFVLVLGWKVFGVAMATLIAQIVSALVSLLYSLKNVSYFHNLGKTNRYDMSIIRKIFRIGSPIALQSCLISISTMVLQGIVNSFGSAVMAAYAISRKMDSMVCSLYLSVCHAVTTYSSQNLGAQKIDRIRQGFRSSVVIINVFNLFLVPLAIIFSGDIVRFFLGANDPALVQVLQVGTPALKITGLCYLALGMIYPSRGVLNGCGDASFSLINGIIEVACRIIYSAVLTRVAFIGKWGIWSTAGLTWITVAIVCYLRYRSNIWTTKSIVEKE